jgi:hypothetical protein
VGFIFYCLHIPWRIAKFGEDRVEVISVSGLGRSPDIRRGSGRIIGASRRWERDRWVKGKKKLVTFHEQKPIDYLITKTYTVTNIKQIIKICNM